jgi:hypothetical protein
MFLTHHAANFAAYGLLSNLANMFESRYERIKQMADLEMAIEKTEEAVRATPPEHPD